MKSVMPSQERFAMVEGAKIQRSTFDRSHGYKTTLDAGKLYPIFFEEALPGDTFNVTPTIFGRFATPLKPIMDNIYADLHFFSVPYRLVWENWKKFMGEQTDPDSSVNYLIPTINSGADASFANLSIYDYFGVPTQVNNVEISALPLRAYNLIFNEWYRDQNLQDSIVTPLSDGPDAPSTYNLLYRNKRKDYFTSALPWAQKAEPVTIPLGDRARITHDAPNANVIGVYSTANSSYTRMASNTESLRGVSTSAPEADSLYADLSDATAITINTLREAATLQQLYERDARGGTRYIEIIKSHFGVTSPDARLQRPEYLGGGSSPLTMTPIPQQSASTSGVTPQGNLAAMGTMAMQSNGFVKTFTEHEMIIGILSIRADLNYQQGLNRAWSRQTRFDFYWPTFANLGEQAVLNKEIFTTGTSTDDDVFGYQERYAEYRYKPSLITGKFRSNDAQSLDVWHLAQDFATAPALNESFIQENPPIDRVIAVPSEPQFIIDCYFDSKAARPMPTYSTPGIRIL